jgi:TonB family protein
MRTNKFIPFLIALILHVIPLSYILLKKNEIASPTGGDSRETRMLGIDLTGFSVARKSSPVNKIQKTNSAQAKPIETVGLPSASPNAGSGGNGNGAGVGAGSGTEHSQGPHFIQMREPTYPPIARQKGLEGKVKIKAAYNSEGVVTKVDIVESSGVSMLDEAAKKTVREWKLTSGAPGEFEKTLEFKLNN